MVIALLERGIKMTIKTINLTGAEVAVTGLDGANAHIRNDGTDAIYAAKAAGISAGADGVLGIPAGQAATVYGISGTVYMLGTGSAQIISNDYSELPFKTSATSGGSGADEVARAAINAHSGNAEIHVTAEDKAKWNAVNYSNPNLLINPDFKINQRGQTEYTAAGYTVDRWKILNVNANGTVSVVNDGIIASKNGTGNAYLLQEIECDYIGKELTLTVCIDGVMYNLTDVIPETGENASITIDNGKWYMTVVNSHLQICCRLTENTNVINFVKLELGSAATLFTPPDPATELAKCQRYYQIRSTGDIAAVDLRPTMRDTPTITQLSDGNYAFSAEL